MSGVATQSLRFGMVGIVNTAVGLAAIYAAMFVFRAAPAAANAIGYAAGFAISFGLNRCWTFRSDGPLRSSLPRFLLVTVVAYLVNLGAVMAASARLGIDPYVSQAIGVALYAVCSFLGCRWFVFAPRHAST